MEKEGELYGIEKSCKDFGERVLDGCFWTGVGLSVVFGGLTYLAFSDCDFNGDRVEGRGVGGSDGVEGVVVEGGYSLENVRY
ncbi:hypothetical protein HOE04_05025 [archaeon]|jgi:hypothetical protein|nr:hypothetical protein [archaeon]